MKEGLKIACSTLQYMLEGIGLIEAVKSIGDLGYEAVELTYGEDFTSGDDEFPDIPELKKAIGDNNLDVCTFSSNLWWGIGGEQAEKNKEMLKKIADLAVDLGAGLLKVSTGFYPAFITKKTTWKYIIENFSWAFDMANSLGLKIAVEPVVSWPVCNTDTFLKMREEIGKDIYINIDPSNLGLAGDDPVESVYKLEKYIGGVHLKDSKYLGVLKEDLYPWMVDMVNSHHFGSKPRHIFKGSRPEFTPMGKGDVDFIGFIKALIKIDNKSYMVVEYEGHLCGYDDCIDKASKDSLAFIKKTIKEIKDEK